MKGSRIHGIVRELKNENIDVIPFTNNQQLFIQRALSPAKVSSIRLNEEEKKAEVFLHPDEVSLAIGKGGLNIRLASMLTGYTIDVYRDLEEGEEDIYLDEFRDEIDDWVVEAAQKPRPGDRQSRRQRPAAAPRPGRPRRHHAPAGNGRATCRIRRLKSLRTAVAIKPLFKISKNRPPISICQ